MDTKSYLRLSKELFQRIEAKLEQYVEEIDFEYGQGKLEISFESGGPKMVINTQQAIHEVWLAGNGHGWHFKYLEESEQWYAQAEQIELFHCLSQLLSNRLGVEVRF